MEGQNKTKGNLEEPRKWGTFQFLKKTEKRKEKIGLGTKFALLLDVFSISRVICIS